MPGAHADSLQGEIQNKKQTKLFFMLVLHLYLPNIEYTDFYLNKTKPIQNILKGIRNMAAGVGRQGGLTS